MYNRIRQKNKLKIVLCFLFSFISMCFVSNIIMHLVSYSVGNEKGNQLTDISYGGCEIRDGYYVPLIDDPQMILSRDSSEEIRGVRIELLEPLETDTLIEVFFPEEKTGEYSAERKSGGIAKAGEKVFCYKIEAGAYNAIRVDINGVVRLQGIYEDNSYRIMLYADRPYRNKIYCLCMIISVGLCVCILYFQKLRDWWERVLKGICSVVDRFCAHQKVFFGLLKLTLTGILMGALIERILTWLLKREYYNTKEMAILALLCILGISFFSFRECYRKNIEIVFLIIFIYCGVCFSYVIPISLGISWDDELHYYRSVSLARFASGEITCVEEQICAGYAKAICDGARWERETCKKNEEYYARIYDAGEVCETNYSFSYKHIAYIPYIIGIWISYGLGLSFCTMFIFVKIFHLMFMGGLLYLSMKVLRSGKILIFIFSMIPTIMFLSANFGHDTWLIVGLIYAFSRYFYELQRKNEVLTFSRFLGIFIPAFLALLPKIVYAPMLFLMAYMPKEKFKEKKWCMAYKACFIFAGLVVIAGVLYFTSGKLVMGTGDVRGGEGVNADMQIQYILANPKEFFSMIKEYLKWYLSYRNSARYLTSMGYMGFVNMPYIFIVILIATMLFDRESCDAETVPILSKMGAVLMIVIIAGICATVMYIVYTPVGKNSIACQGRYLLPVLFPSLYMITRFGKFTEFKKKISLEVLNMVIIFVSVSFLMYNLWMSYAVKYWF